MSKDKLLNACKAIQKAYCRTDKGQPLAVASAIKLVNEAIKEYLK